MRTRSSHGTKLAAPLMAAVLATVSALEAPQGPFGSDHARRQPLRVMAVARNATPAVDMDSVMFVCRPRPPNRPCPSATTTTTEPGATTTTTATTSTTVPTTTTVVTT